MRTKFVVSRVIASWGGSIFAGNKPRDVREGEDKIGDR